MRMSITSAAGVVALLDESDAEVKHFALKKLDEIVDIFWHEISESVGKIEMMYEDESFRHRDLAALVVSKVYYHLGAFEDSVNFALGAGSLFEVNDTSEYVETIVSKCIDLYVKQSVQRTEGEPDDVGRNRNLEVVVNRMFQRCFDDRQFKQAVGIALETRRMDIFEDAILKSDDVPGMLAYSFRVCLSLIQNRQFRNKVLKALVDLYKRLAVPDYISVCQCLIFLDEPQTVAEILETLIKKTEDSALMAYQIGFDLYESATQQFLQSVQAALRQTAPAPIQTAAPPTLVAQPEGEGEEESAMEVDEKQPVVAPVTPAAPLSEADKLIQDRLTKLHTILGGDTTIALHLQFLIRSNKTDLLVLKNTKDAVRNSVCHNATVMANALMHCGTTSDQFLRDNLEWLARATNWAKFTATASLGVIHKGHEKEALHLMSTYLPKDSGPGSAYSEGGGLYALGLIHANHGGEITEYLLTQLKEASTDIVRHGACLGVGLAAMGTARQDVYDQLKTHLNQDEAITGL
jgi:26S proteasome regulatory subunit N2